MSNVLDSFMPTAVAVGSSKHLTMTIHWQKEQTQCQHIMVSILMLKTLKGYSTKPSCKKSPMMIMTLMTMTMRI